MVIRHDFPLSTACAAAVHEDATGPLGWLIESLEQTWYTAKFRASIGEPVLGILLHVDEMVAWVVMGGMAIDSPDAIDALRKQAAAQVETVVKNDWITDWFTGDAVKLWSPSAAKKAEGEGQDTMTKGDTMARRRALTTLNRVGGWIYHVHPGTYIVCETVDDVAAQVALPREKVQLALERIQAHNETLKRPSWVVDAARLAAAAEAE